MLYLKMKTYSKPGRLHMFLYATRFLRVRNLLCIRELRATFNQVLYTGSSFYFEMRSIACPRRPGMLGRATQLSSTQFVLGVDVKNPIVIGVIGPYERDCCPFEAFIYITFIFQLKRIYEFSTS